MAGDIISALAEQQAELSRLLDGLDEPGWHRPSRCDGWDVADVVLHLCQTNEMAIASASGRFAEGLAALTDGIGQARDVDDGAALMVARERGIGPVAISARWRAVADELHQRLAATDPHARVDWVAGQLSVRTLATTRLAETWIHTGDVAEAIGVELEPADRLRHIARLAWRTLPYAFARAGREMTGPVAFRLRGPQGDAWDLEPDDAAATSISGDAVELCLVAARRLDPSETRLRGEGPDADAVLELVRTYA